MPVGTTRVVLGEVDEPVDPRAEQVFDDFGDPLEFPPTLLPGVGACGEPAFDHPVGPRPAVFPFSGVGVESECGYAPGVAGLVDQDLVHHRAPEVLDEPVGIHGNGFVP